MNTLEAREVWLAVLRDPRSERHTRSLENRENPNARCCLGHACHALGLERVEDAYSIIYCDEGKYFGEDTHLPAGACEKLDIERTGALHHQTEFPDWALRSYGSLSTMNDLDPGATPSRMADFIEQCFANDWLLPYEGGRV